MELTHSTRWQRLREWLVQMLEARANRYRHTGQKTDKTPSA